MYIYTGERLKDPPVTARDNSRLSFPLRNDHLNFLQMLHNNQFDVTLIFEPLSERVWFVLFLCACFGSLRKQTQMPAHA